MRKRPIFALLPVFALILGTSCASKSTKTEIEPGSPAYYWNAAQAAHAKGDFSQAAESLRRLTTGSTSNEFRDRAEVWLMTLSAGLARGDMAWVDVLQKGSKLDRTKQAEFRKAITAATTDANQNAMQYAEIAHGSMTRGLPAEIPLSFTLPVLDANATSVEAGKIPKGMLPPQAELEAYWSQFQRHYVVLGIARASGSGEDTAKATATLAGNDNKQPVDAWRLNIAREFITLAEFYSPKKLDHAARAKVMIDEAKEVLAAVPATAESKELRKQVDALAKKLLKPATS